MTMPSAQVVCTMAFATTVDGDTVVVHEGDVYTATHPIVKSHAALFAPRQSHDVTAAPPRSRARKGS